MTIEQAIKWCEGRYQGALMPAATEAYKMCVAALRAQQEAEKNEPLTWEQLVKMVGLPVWIRETGSKADYTDYWAIVSYYDEELDEVGLPNGNDKNDYGHKDSYGGTWLAYRRPPVKEKT